MFRNRSKTDRFGIKFGGDKDDRANRSGRHRALKFVVRSRDIYNACLAENRMLCWFGGRISTGKDYLSYGTRRPGFDTTIAALSAAVTIFGEMSKVAFPEPSEFTSAKNTMQSCCCAGSKLNKITQLLKYL